MLAGLVALSLVIRATGLDLVVSRAFYRPGSDPAWWGADRQPWDFLYRFGPWPGNTAGAISLVLLVASVFTRRPRRHRRACWLLLLVLALGPGLVVNVIAKNQWGRPRPRDIVEFGGKMPYVPLGLPTGLGGQSFPSGHASMGFYWLTLYVLWRGRRPRAARAGLALGLAAGSAMGFQRLATGAHFLSDVVWAGGVDYLAAIAVDRLIEAYPRPAPEVPAPGPAVS